MKSDLKSESLKRKFIIMLFVYNFKIGCPKKNRENYPKGHLNKVIKILRLKLSPGGVRANWPWDSWALIYEILLSGGFLGNLL